MAASGLTPDHIIWAYRILLDREPESDQAIAGKLTGCRSTRDLRLELIASDEYRTKNPEFAQEADAPVAIKVLADGTRIFLNLADHAIGVPVLRGHYEPAETRFARRSVSPGDVVVDAGAHVGFFALQFATAVGPTGHVYAFEPFAANAALLEQSIRENHYESRMTLVRAAVGDTAGSVSLYFARETLNLGGAFALSSDAPPPADLERAIVPAVRLDDYALGRPVRFLKMDVEGAEPAVLRGAERILREDRPILMSEIHRSQLARVSHTTPDDFARHLSGFGYRPYQIEADGSTTPLQALPDVPVVTVAFIADGPAGTHRGRV